MKAVFGDDPELLTFLSLFTREVVGWCVCERKKNVDKLLVIASLLLETPGLATTRIEQRGPTNCTVVAQFEKKENILCDCTNIELNFSFVASLVTFFVPTVIVGLA